VIGETEILAMSNGVSGVVLIADTAHEGDVESCLDGAVDYIMDEPNNDDIELMADENGDLIEGVDDDVAFAAYSYTDAEGAAQALYAECRVIVPGESTLEISHFVALDDFDDEVAAREDLLAGLQLGD
jgi:hypothetical protein